MHKQNLQKTASEEMSNVMFAAMSALRPHAAINSGDKAVETGATSALNHTFGNISLHPAAPILQTKLSVNKSGDKYEQEADAMADKIVGENVGDSIERNTVSKSITTLMQQKKEANLTVNPGLSNKIISLQGNGNNIDTGMQSYMSNRFANDFSKVKLHTDSEAIKMNEELNARAFTVGNDIYFNKGEYNPTSQNSKHLLAHELTHTIQQQGTNMQVQKEDKKDPTDAPKPEVDFKILPPDLKFRFHHLLFEADTSKVKLDYQIQGMKAGLSYKYGSELGLSMRKGDAGASFGWTPGANDFKLKLSSGLISTRFSASPGIGKYSAGLHLGDPILPMEDDMSKTFMAGGAAAGNIVSGLQDPGDLLQYYQQHKSDIQNVSESADLFGKITDYGKKNVRFGADLLFSYDPVNKVVVTVKVGARWVF